MERMSQTLSPLLRVVEKFSSNKMEHKVLNKMLPWARVPKSTHLRNVLAFSLSCCNLVQLPLLKIVFADFRSKSLFIDATWISTFSPAPHLCLRWADFWKPTWRSLQLPDSESQSKANSVFVDKVQQLICSCPFEPLTMEGESVCPRPTYLPWRSSILGDHGYII